jgi:hypothetical protein
VPRAQRELPGGIALPAVVFLVSSTIFVVCWLNPDLVDLGPNLSASGIGVLGAAMSSMWLLIAIGLRKPKS